MTPGMESRGLRVLIALAGTVLGAALQLQQAALWPAHVYACVLACALAIALFARRFAHWCDRVPWVASPIAALLLAATCGAMAGAGLAGWRASVFAASALPPVLEGRDLSLTGRIAKLPQRGPRQLRFAFDVESASEPGGSAAIEGVPPRVSLGWYADSGAPWVRDEAAAEPLAAPGPVHAGERWRFTVRLKAPHGSLNPHGFDAELKAWEQGEQASGTVRSGERIAPPERLASAGSHRLERLRERVRDAILERVADRSRAGVLAALVTGDQGAVERGDWEVFRGTGVTHLMAISGLHISMFAWIAASCVGALWRRSQRLMLCWPAQQAALAGGLLLAACYALFSGWGVPAQRTVLMLATVGLLRLGGRRWPWPWVWLLACAVVVLVDPWALMQAGFWLSFVAVGVLFAADGAAPEAEAAGPMARLLRLCRAQWVVTLALTPLTLLLFQQISLVGLLANLVAIPWVTLVVMPLALAGMAIPALWQLAAQAVGLLSWFLQELAGLSFASFSLPAPPLWMAVAGVAGGVLLAMRLPASVRALGLPLLLPALLWQAPRPAPGEFDLLAADVGQGNAVLVRTAQHALLYDAGPRYGLDSDAGQRVLVPLLRALGEKLDLVLLSHRDTDHTGGAPAVLAAQPGARLLSSIEHGHALQAQRPATRCVAGQRWQWDGVDFEILHPVESDYTAFTARPNALSCVLRIGNGRATALLAGDIERMQEMALVARTPALRADLLLVPHHGSRSSSTPLLLDAVRPAIALVQAGWRNRFGHPAAEVVQRYRERGIELLDSPHCGAASWSSEAPLAWRCERQAAARYWHHRPP